MSGGATILFVRNEQFDDGATGALGAAGFSVREVTAVSEAMSVLQAETIDCVVTNVEVTGSDGTHYLGGLEVLETVGSRYPDIPTLLYSEIDNHNLTVEAYRRDAFGYVPAQSISSAHDRLLRQTEATIAHLPAQQRATRESEINATVRRVNQALVRSSSRSDIERRVCEEVTETPRYTRACIADVVEGDLTVRANSDPYGGTESWEPAVSDVLLEASRAETPVSTEVELTPDGGGTVAQRHERTLAVPLAYDTDRYGVLAVYSDRNNAFEDDEQHTFREMGSNVALAINAVETSHRLETRKRELQAQKDRLAELARIISHELRNPLQTVMGRFELVSADVDHPELEVMERNHEQLSFLIDDMLELTRRGARSYDPEPVTLDEAMTAAWETVPAENASLDVLAEQTVVADPDRLQQLFQNFLRAGIQDGDAPVSVELGPLPDGFYLQHDGQSLSDESRSPFELRYATSQEGVGLGLRVIEEIAAGHDWEVELPASTDGTSRLEVHGVETP